jgi:hypothetical protein
MTNILNTCKGLIRSFVGSSSPGPMDLDNGKKPGLFAQCSFAIVRSASLTEQEADAVGHVRTHLDVD